MYIRHMTKKWPANWTKEGYQGEQFPYWCIDLRDANNDPITTYTSQLVRINLALSTRTVVQSFTVSGGLVQEGSLTTLEALIPEDTAPKGYEFEWRVVTPGGLPFKMGAGFFRVKQSFTNG